MSANPTRVDWGAADQASPLQEGNRVLESIAQREALQSLVAFSGLHRRIRNRREANGSSNRDLFETERFILDEVLQLICDRAQAVTQADGVVIALAEESSAELTSSNLAVGGLTAKRLEMVCRAAAGPLAVERGVRLIGESEFLQDCLESGHILRCDDCEIDTRVELDFARAIGARSTVLVPLRGRYQRLGVLQAFSATPWAFPDHDVRGFELFAELVLSALRPEDQDRRIRWLADVADEVLRPRVAATVVANQAPTEVPEIVAPEILVPEILVGAEIVEKIEPSTGLVDESPENPTLPPVLRPSYSSRFDGNAESRALPETNHESNLDATDVETELAVVDSHAIAQTPPAPLDEVLEVLAQTIAIPEEVLSAESAGGALSDGSDKRATNLEPPHFLPTPSLFSTPRNSRPALNVVMGLIAVAALFSAGAWWGMQVHDKTSATKFATKSAASGSATNTAPRSVTAPVPPAAVLTPAVSGKASDNPMNPQQVDLEDAPLSAVPEDKLASLPKVTGVRHWSSSMGSTVVIDMQDNVPYEVHRLMSPERIYFDLHDTALPPELQGKTMDVGDASLTRVRVAQPVAGVTRVVLDTKDGSNFSVSMESNPYRLVVELRGSDKSLAASGLTANYTASSHTAASSNAAPSLTKTAPLADLAAKESDRTLSARTGKFRIVLDAGHGGWDLGTVGKQGLLEKDLVLDVTERLGRLLKARLGSDVVFTRSSDTYLPLEQRADIANQAQADLFVSVHANYSSSAAARGVETYYTNLFSAPGSREVEKHDDGTFTRPTPISLSASALHEKIEESRRLATSVQRALYATLAAKSPDIRNRGIKDSAFAVLTGTTMPAILTEISFVSSPADEHKLRSAAYRQQIAEALYQGIAHYQQSSPRTKVAQLQTSATRR